jgi:glutaredoxin
VKGIARAPKLRDSRVQRFHASVCKLPRPIPILAGIEIEQFLDLFEREARRLRLFDEAQPPHMIGAVAANPSLARWCLEQASALVEADRLHAHAAPNSKAADGQRVNPLTLYHGTEAISAAYRMTRRSEVSDMANHPKLARRGVLYRMVMPEHTCPWGIKAKALLRRQDHEVEDHHLTTRAQTDAFKAEHGVVTTPQVFIGGTRIGGYDDLKRYFGKRVIDPKASSYRPVIALFAVTALMALAASYGATGQLLTARTAQWFIAFSMSMLALLKLQNVEAFSAMFLNYDLFAKRWVPYSYIYPVAEAVAGILMISGALTWLSIPIALFIGTIGAVSVFKAVYIDKRALKCACVGGSSNVPLGFVSLTENLMMIGMAVWMAAM